MKLVERNVHIDTVEFGSKTSVVKNTLIINRDELLSLIKESSGFEDVRIELALPGDNCRIVRVADVIEPRIKISGCGQVFPGIISPLEIVGRRGNRLPKRCCCCGNMANGITGSYGN